MKYTLLKWLPKSWSYHRLDALKRSWFVKWPPRRSTTGHNGIPVVIKITKVRLQCSLSLSLKITIGSRMVILICSKPIIAKHIKKVLLTNSSVFVKKITVPFVIFIFIDELIRTIKISHEFNCFSLHEFRVCTRFE